MTSHVDHVFSFSSSLAFRPSITGGLSLLQHKKWNWLGHVHPVCTLALFKLYVLFAQGLLYVHFSCGGHKVRSFATDSSRIARTKPVFASTNLKAEAPYPGLSGR